MALLYKRLFEMLWLQESRIELWLHSLVQIDGSRDEPNIPLLTWLELLLASLELAELILWLFNLVWKGARKVKAALSSLVFMRTRDFSFLTSILSAVCSSLCSLNPAQLFATKPLPLYPWSTPTQPWLLLRASLLAGWAQLQGTLGLSAGHRGGSEELFMARGEFAHHSWLWEAAKQFVNPAALLDECSSSSTGTQGVLQRPFQGVVFEAVSPSAFCVLLF